MCLRASAKDELPRLMGQSQAAAVRGRVCSTSSDTPTCLRQADVPPGESGSFLSMIISPGDAWFVRMTAT